ncbi:MAG: aspartate kinase [Bdellovibrionota bacterium]|nr:MAG: aspartate kinase [Bdellovibrionota bacterium]
MTIIVKKFGGTSVGSLQRIHAAATRVATFRSKHPDAQIVVVASAMSGETDRLLSLARNLTQNTYPRELDAVAATGEQVSCALLAMALEDAGVPAISLNAFQLPILTDQQHQSAHIERISSERVQNELAQGKTVVVTGFQGITAGGDLTTLGRGGSDISAVALAAALRAEACYIYTDVDGVYSADPRIVKQPRRMGKVSHEEMLELASLGAKVLHPRSVFFAMRYKVPLVVLSSFSHGGGTWIVSEDRIMEKPSIVGIAYRLDEAKLTVERLSSTSQPLKLIFSALAKEQIGLDMITQTGYSNGHTDISFNVPDEKSERALHIVQQLVPELGARGASLERDLARVSVVGAGIRYHADVAARVFSLLAGEGIDVRMISTSDIRISVVVPRKYCEVAVRVLHDGLIDLSETPGEIPVESVSVPAV